jgi:16S rRNA (cytosine1402-N4)-methyltransferase
VTKSSSLYHKTVLLHETVQGVLLNKPGGFYIDVTFGGGGHTRALLEADPTCTVLALDWDKKALDLNAPPLAEEFKNRFIYRWANFADLWTLLRREKITRVDGLVADFGTSQTQIKAADGFSFSVDSPLDMRMSKNFGTLTAAKLIEHAEARELAHIFKTYGEEGHAWKIARAIVEARGIEPITTTKRLADLIEKIIPRVFGSKLSSKGRVSIHPATKVFQALRIVVNRELEHIDTLLKLVPNILSPGGRFACISFHSLEDRLVKQGFKRDADLGKLVIITPKPITASEEELKSNPSARSAKLRIAQRSEIL